MKIFYIANARLPTEKAHGIQIMKMCEAFSKLGHEVQLLVPKRISHLTEEAFSYYGLEPSFEITYLATIDLIRLSGLVPKLFSYLQNWYFADSVGRYLKKQNPDLILSRDEMTAIKIHDFPRLILEVHSISRLMGKQVSRLNEKLFKIIVITGGLKKELEVLGFNPEKIIVLPDAVDIEQFKTFDSKFKIREELGLPLDKKIVMYTGHLYEWKGAGVLLEAAQKSNIPSQSPLKIRGEAGGIVFVFVGGTDHDIARFKEQARGLENVLILGHRPYSEIPKYLAAADVLVLPNSAKENISKYYTSPMKLFEYMASGRPIAASDLPSLREILNEDTAVFAFPDDPESLTLAIQKILSDKELSARITQNSRELVKTFTWGGRAKKILNFIRWSDRRWC